MAVVVAKTVMGALPEIGLRHRPDFKAVSRFDFVRLIEPEITIGKAVRGKIIFNIQGLLPQARMASIAVSSSLNISMPGLSGFRGFG